jgi:hypothetical protein
MELADADIRKGPGVHEDRGPFQGLHESWLDGILHYGSERAACANVIARHWISVLRACDDHATKAFSKIAQA